MGRVCVLSSGRAIALAGAIAASLVLTLPPRAAIAEMPAEARAVVDALKLDAALLRDWESEHRIPEDVLAGARREGQLRVNGSWKPAEWETMIGAFKARYPFIKVHYTRTGTSSRSRVPLVAYLQGRYTTDFLTGIDTDIEGYKKHNALEPLTGVPNRANIPLQYGGAQDSWSGVRLRFYCLAYNTNLVSRKDLPKTWGDLASSPAFSDGKLAVWYGIASWLLPIWGKNGQDFTVRFVDDLFVRAKAQKRKEGATSLLSLLGAGEFNGVLATAGYNVRKLREKGAPVGFHCADFALVTSSSVGILRGAPNRNAGKVFLNWLLSKEGQISQFHYDGAPPIHKDLQLPRFIPFPEEILGKPVSFRSPELLAEGMPKLLKIWQPYWGGSR